MTDGNRTTQDLDDPDTGDGALASNASEKYSLVDYTSSSNAGNPLGDEPTRDSRRLIFNVVAGGGVNIVKIALQLVMLPLMAHLLGPTEFGIYALVLPAVSLLMTLADAGLGASLAREPPESDVVWSTAFWLVLMLGIVLAAIMIVWGVLLAQIAHEPRALGLMALLSCSFVFVTLSVVPGARLTQERRLVAISMADLASNIVGAVVGVTLAAFGAGALSLATQFVVAWATRFLIMNSLAFVRPKFMFDLPALKGHISIGSSIVFSRLADSAGRFTENLVFGRMFGPATLGAYTFSNQVSRFVCEAASNPLWAALYAQALGENDAQVRQLHRRLMHLLALLVAPVAFITSATAPSLIHVILGPTWQGAGPILSVLIPFYALNVIATLSGSVLLSRGVGWAIFWLMLFLVVGRVVAASAGYWIGPIGVAWAVGCAQVGYSALSLYALQRANMAATRAMFAEIWAPTVAGAAAGIVAYFAINAMPATLVNVVIVLVAGMVFYVVALAVLQGKRLWNDFLAVKQALRR